MQSAKRCIFQGNLKGTFCQLVPCLHQPASLTFTQISQLLSSIFFIASTFPRLFYGALSTWVCATGTVSLSMETTTTTSWLQYATLGGCYDTSTHDCYLCCGMLLINYGTLVRYNEVSNAILFSVFLHKFFLLFIIFHRFNLRQYNFTSGLDLITTNTELSDMESDPF